MKPQKTLRLLKATIFILVVIFYGVSSGIIAQILFAIVLAMYLLEIFQKDINQTKWNKRSSFVY